MTENKNENIELRIEPATPENVTQVENIEQVEETSTPEIVTQVVNNTQEDDETDIQENVTQVVNDTQEDETDIEIHNLKNKNINLCGKIYNLKHI